MAETDKVRILIDEAIISNSALLLKMEGGPSVP